VERRGRLRSLSPPGEGGGEGVLYQYFYDPAGRLIEAKTPSGSAEYAYYPNGSRESLTLPNGIVTTYAYDSLLRLEAMEHKNSQSELVASFDYTIGRTGKRTGVTENIGGMATECAYAYDGLDRLKTATRNGTEDEVFAYDLVGNRVSKTLGASTTSYVYNALDRLETETTGGVNTAYNYDGNGNLTAKTSEGQTESYVYDSRNRLRQVYQGATGQVSIPPSKPEWLGINLT